MYLTRQREHGTQFAYRVVYTDPIDPAFGTMTCRMWAYSDEDLFIDWDESNDGDSFAIVSFKREEVPAGAYTANHGYTLRRPGGAA